MGRTSGAVEHLKTLCCLGLPPSSAAIAVAPLLHEIIPHGWTRIGLYDNDHMICGGHCEQTELLPLWRKRYCEFSEAPFGPGPRFFRRERRALGIGWMLPIQGQGWLDSAWYREMERPLDACWILDAVIGEGGRPYAFLGLTRPRCARRFTADDVRRLDPLRPWLAHAFRPTGSDGAIAGKHRLLGTSNTPVLSGQIVANLDAQIVYQTQTAGVLLAALIGEPLLNLTRNVPVRSGLPAPVLKLLQQLAGAANGMCCAPPRMQILSAHGAFTLDAKWLMPASTNPADAAKDPKSCLIAVTIELCEHAVARAARVLRESGATPTQLKVGIQLALGKSKPAIADELGLKLNTVADLTRKLYQTLDVHNAAQLGSKLWLAQPQSLCPLAAKIAAAA
jgi:DNA-binding CsgD family transcriptional regulator